MPKYKNEEKFEILERINIHDLAMSLETAFTEEEIPVALQVVNANQVKPFTIRLVVTYFEYRDDLGQNIQIKGKVLDMPNLENKLFVGHCWLVEDRRYNFGHFHVYDQ